MATVSSLQFAAVARGRNAKGVLALALTGMAALPALLLSLPITPLNAQTACVGCETTAAPPQEQATDTAASEPVGVTRKVSPKSVQHENPPRDYYPPAARAEKREGRVGFTLTIDANGRPTECQVTSSSGHADLDAATCSNLMQRARFNPALENGIAVPSTYSHVVRWELPRDDARGMPAPDRAPLAQSAPPLMPPIVGPTRMLKLKGNPGEWEAYRGSCQRARTWLREQLVLPYPSAPMAAQQIAKSLAAAAMLTWTQPLAARL